MFCEICGSKLEKKEIFYEKHRIREKAVFDKKTGKKNYDLVCSKFGCKHSDHDYIYVNGHSGDMACTRCDWYHKFTCPGANWH